MRAVTRAILAVIFAVALAGTSWAQVFYPPTPGADCAPVRANARPRRNQLRVTVLVENHGSVRAACATALIVVSSPPGAPPPEVRGGGEKNLREGRTRRVRFRVRPVQPGMYTLRVCSTSVEPPDSHPADDCATGTVTV